MKLIWWVVLGLLMACMVGQAEEISLTAGDYTVKFDPGYPTNSIDYRTVDSSGLKRTIANADDRLFIAVLDAFDRPYFYADTLNSYDIMAAFRQNSITKILGVNDLFMPSLSPINIDGYPAAVGLFHYYDDPINNPTNFSTLWEIEARLGQRVGLNMLIGDYEAFNKTCNSIRINKIN